MKTRLYTVQSYSKRKGGCHNPPRFGLQPMTHAEACAFKRNCTTEATGYGLVEWPADVPHPPLPHEALILYTKSRKQGLQVGQWLVNNRIGFSSILYGKGERIHTNILTPEQQAQFTAAFPNL